MPPVSTVNSPIMSGHLDRPTSSASTMSLNQVKTRQAPYLSQHVIYRNVLVTKHQKGDPDWFWRSNASSFGRGGTKDMYGNTYIRDPNSGTWFRDWDHMERPGAKRCTAGFVWPTPQQVDEEFRLSKSSSEPNLRPKSQGGGGPQQSSSRPGTGAR
eukprot:gnl/TRDRNA2_/TRDRNA2_83999_c2_seq1.p1 gnl/TRDRNA2_/TRDRNA2_83999_c2~~gnl/TRDRNA2_/TRDRNA2_83999_c2_seq1.p1  ORF type:complete len:156 (+),score=17.72 gnl/TRDRNA2_/TRDRNA2_83999_c2_seq1:91-558(+)